MCTEAFRFFKYFAVYLYPQIFTFKIYIKLFILNKDELVETMTLLGRIIHRRNKVVVEKDQTQTVDCSNVCVTVNCFLRHEAQIIDFDQTFLSS